MQEDLRDKYGADAYAAGSTLQPKTFADRLAQRDSIDQHFTRLWLDFAIEGLVRRPALDLRNRLLVLVGQYTMAKSHRALEDTILAALKARPDLGVDSWNDVKRMDVRPDRGIVKVWLQSDWEAQIDLGTAEILQVAFRRSDWIESIHDGSIFGDTVKLGVFFPTALTLVLLWLGGMWMWLYPFIGRRRVRRAKAVMSPRQSRPRSLVTPQT